MIRERKVRRALASLVIFFVTMVPLCAFAGSALDVVKVNANAVLDVLRDPKLKGEAGKKVKLDRVLAVSNGSELTLGTPDVKGAAVTVEVVAIVRGDKVINFKKKRRKGFHKKIGHRQELTQIKVESVG